MMWIIGPESPKKPYNPLAPALIEDILEDFMKNTDSSTIKIKETEKQLIWVSSQAIGWRSTLLWVQYLKIRLVGINFGEGIRAV